jgi:hypothetical protein
MQVLASEARTADAAPDRSSRRRFVPRPFVGADAAAAR